MRMLKIFLTSAFAMVSFACHTMTAFERAAGKGAYATIDVLVLDELNAPIENAQVDIWFGMIEARKTTKKTAFTDATGHATITGLTCGNDVQIVTYHPEYYSSRKKLCFVTRGKKFEVKGRQWMPEKMEYTLRMRKIRNPIRLDTKAYSLHFPSTNEWYGADLLLGDWVAPNGKGETVDVEFIYSWEGEEPRKKTKESLALRFPEKPNGGTKMPVLEECCHSYAYEASTNLVCTQLFTSSNTSYWNGHLTENDSDLTFRIRSVTNSVGEIVSCRYGRFKRIEYSIQRNRTGVVILNYDMNPTPMDNNLERANTRLLLN